MAELERMGLDAEQADAYVATNNDGHALEDSSLGQLRKLTEGLEIQ